MIFPLRTIGLRNIHAVSSHIPGGESLLLDVSDVEHQIGDAMTERDLQILSNGIASVNGSVVRRQVNSVCGVSSNHSVQFSAFQCRTQSSPIRRIVAAAVPFPLFGMVPLTLPLVLLECFFAVDRMVGPPGGDGFTEPSWHLRIVLALSSSADESLPQAERTIVWWSPAGRPM